MDEKSREPGEKERRLQEAEDLHHYGRGGAGGFLGKQAGSFLWVPVTTAIIKGLLSACHCYKCYAFFFFFFRHTSLKTANGGVSVVAQP